MMLQPGKADRGVTCMLAQAEEVMEATVSMTLVVGSCAVKVDGAIVAIKDWQGVQ